MAGFLRESVGDYPYAKAFFTLADELGLSGEAV